MRELLRRAKSAGCPVLVLTVDLPTPGARFRDVRSGFRGLTGWQSMINQGIDGLSHPRWGPGMCGPGAGRIRSETSKVLWRRVDPSPTFSTGLPPISALAHLARSGLDSRRVGRPDCGEGNIGPGRCQGRQAGRCTGIIVSNHGGRQLDSVRSAVSALPPIVDLVGADLEVYVDSGIRSGLDVLKALALGARACSIGRAWAFALAAGGRAGVLQMLEILRAELRSCDDPQRLSGGAQSQPRDAR